MNVKPLFDKVVLKKSEKEVKSKSGIILSSSAQEEPDYLEVVAVGEGMCIDNVLQPMKVSVGDKVIITKFAGTQIKIEDKEYTIVSQQEILAIVE